MNEVAPSVGQPVAAPPREPSDVELRSVIELAFTVAISGARLRPPVAPPQALRRYLKLSKLPAAASATVRKALEDDDEFRRRVGRVATEELAGGTIGMLWLTRPDGWEHDIAPLLSAPPLDVDAVGAIDSTGSARTEQRRREAAEAALARVRAELVAAHAESISHQAEAVAAGSLASAAQTALAGAEQRADVASAGAERQRRRAEQAEQLVARLQGELAQAKGQIAELTATRDEALRARQIAEDLLAVVADGGLQSATLAVPTIAAPGVAVPGVAAVDPAAAAATARVAERVGEIAAALGALGHDLGNLVATWQAPGQAAGGGSGAGAVSAGRPAGGVEFPPPGTVALAGRRVETRRRPTSLPGAVAADPIESALYLMRQPSAVTIVDGYNVAKLGWPDLALAEQRESCLDALEDLVRRLAVRFQVVFDGADVGGVLSGRRLVRVRFTAAGVTADDEIRALVHAMPSGQPVVVATNDREVVRSVRAAGANPISSDQLLAVARR